MAQGKLLETGAGAGVSPTAWGGARDQRTGPPLQQIHQWVLVYLIFLISNDSLILFGGPTYWSPSKPVGASLSKVFSHQSYITFFLSLAYCMLTD